MKTLKTLLPIFLLLLAAPALADDLVVAGADFWHTPADGSTYYDFGQDPIPAGFFCRSSEPFTEKVSFHGVPLATVPANALGAIDTIVERLDDAPFGANGRAVTRVRPLALSLASDQPIQTRCGSYRVEVGLADVAQPEATMVIVKDGERGGYFNSSLGLEIRLTFVDEKGQRLVLDRRVDFPYSTDIPWSHERPGDVRSAGLVALDTDADGVGGAFVPSTGNFFAGHATDGRITVQNCHGSGTDQHCTDPLCGPDVYCHLP